jgi:subtilisin family serine protease
LHFNFLFLFKRNNIITMEVKKLLFINLTIRLSLMRHHQLKLLRLFDDVKASASKEFTILNGKKSTATLKSLRTSGLSQTTPALMMEKSGEFKMYPTKSLRVKLKASKTKKDILNLVGDDSLLEIEENYGVLQISIKDIHDAIDIANEIYEAGLAEFSMPDFFIPIFLNQQIQDPLFPLQFQMNNTGQVIDGVAGINDMDCNALEAWDLNLGNDVTVAIIDDGLDTHDDFGNRLIGGFTPANNGNGGSIGSHGMNCAGIVGSTHDNLGLRGVAPNVNLLAVNIFAAGTTTGQIANGIQWAVDNGATVLSNSWSFGGVPCGFTNADIENALQDATDDGAVIIFASGNTGGCVNYPATNPNVISVGAFDNRGVLFNYSSRGPELDLTAPSGETNYIGNVRTTDRMGNAGRLPGNYEPSFGGTSASCPVVAGVAALILSVNPNLTPQQVRNTLINTAIDMGAAGFDNNFGFGRVNAFAAVELTINQTASLSGIQYLCFNQSQNVNLTNQLSTNVTWSSSSNVRIISSNNQSATIEPRFSSSSGNGFVRANLGNGIIRTTNFWVGYASFPSSSTGQVYVQGFYGQSSITLASDALYFFQATGGQGNTGYTWHLPSGFSFNGSSTGTVAQIWTSSNGGNYRLVVRPVNPCGSEGGTRTIDIYIPGSGGGIGPDPNCPLPPCQVPHAANYGINASNTELIKIIYKDRHENLILGGFDQNSALSLYTLSGHLILTSQSGTRINVSGIRSGIYFAMVNENGVITRQKILIN